MVVSTDQRASLSFVLSLTQPTGRGIEEKHNNDNKNKNLKKEEAKERKKAQPTTQQ